MTKVSDNAFPSLLITEGTEPSAPASGKQRVYIDSTTHKLKRTDSSGADVTVEAHELDYVEFTSNVNITATTSAGSDVIVTANSVTYDGTAVRVRTQAGYWECPAANSLVIVLWDNTAGAALGTIAQFTNPDATNVMRVGGTFERRFTPAAGARVLSIRGFVGSAATGVIGVGAGGAGVRMPGFIGITRA